MIQCHEPPFVLREFKIEVTYRCNLNCIHCSSDARPSNLLEMDCDTCLRILEEAAAMGAEEVAFSGGEPLLWPYIFDAVASAIANGLSVTVYTSGNVDDFAKKAAEIVKLGARRFIFSIFGGTATTHERITRVTGSFDGTLCAMDEACKSGLATELHFVPLPGNYRELKDVAALGRKHGASILSVLRLVYQGRAALLRGRGLDRVQNLELRRQIRELRHSGYSIRTGSPYNFLMLNAKPKCCAAIDRLVIAPDCRLYPCDAFKQVAAEEIVGTLNYSSLNEDGLPECWEKSPYLEAIREYLTTSFEEPCESCQLLDRCLSGCLAQKVVTFGNLEKRPDPDCLGPNFLED